MSTLTILDCRQGVNALKCSSEVESIHFPPEVELTLLSDLMRPEHGYLRMAPTKAQGIILNTRRKNASITKNF